MKSIIILCMSLVFLAMGTALSLAVFQLDNNPGAGGEYSTSQPAALLNDSKPLAGNLEKATSLSLLGQEQRADTSLFSGSIFSWARMSLEAKTAKQSENGAMEPTLIFLFGAAIFGLASFSRRLFLK